ncbi:TPA: winged helix-turn-helix domain-containing protein [Salmonella enterica subsp. salamae serovar 28:r:e,n,z15]|nr:winged helix-turn-helix domain-containing protein [Salmonella enterica subsp. salamae serovar 28:r:e,n,z15]
MKNLIIINEIVVFEPEKNRLTPLADYPARGVALHAPVSACLLLLLQHNHQPVTQKFLFSEVWEKNGAIVSTNAIYQSIALIRKGLRAAGLEEEVIVTLPKVGFKADATIKIVPDQDIIAALSNVQENITPDIPAPTPTGSQHTRPWIVLLRPFSLLIAACGVALLLVIFYKCLHSASNYTHYNYTGKINNCELYSSWSGKEKSTNVFKQIYTNQNLSCPPAKIIYMTLNNTQSGTSVLICRDRIDSPQAKCKALFFMEKYDD